MNNLLDRWLKKTVGESTPPAKVAPPPPNATPAPDPNSPNNRQNQPHFGSGRNQNPPGKFVKPRPPRSNEPQASGPLPIDSGDDKARLVPLGGMEQVGRNMKTIFFKNEIVVIDCGLQFPEADMFGVDYVIPDTRILEERKDRIRGMLITHGHLDHIGALPHILPRLNFPPLYGTKLTLGLARARLAEYGLEKKTTFHEVNPGEREIKLGTHFRVEFFRVNHSIPDATGVAVHTPAGTIVHTGDFKFDYTPADGQHADFAKLAELGQKGVSLLLADSTNAEKPGHTLSETVIAKNLAETIEKAKGRIIVATFSSLIGRIQHVLNAAHATGRRVFVSGRSMQQNIEMAVKMGYLKIPQGLVRQLQRGNEVQELPPNKVLILCTGSQGEEMSALTRISLGEHQTIQVKTGDTIIFSSTPIPGNETAMVGMINNLIRLGANLVTNRHLDVHTSGHAQQEDLKLMHSLTRPKNLMPIHGELMMRMAHKKIGMSVGIPEENIYLVDNGDILEIQGASVQKNKSKVRVADIMIDGLGVGDIGTQVLREREAMSENGVVVLIFKAYAESQKLVSDPEVISRGFIYMKESAAVVDETRAVARKAYEDAIAAGKVDYKDLRGEITRAVASFIRRRLDREPLILPFTIKI